MLRKIKQSRAFFSNRILFLKYFSGFVSGQFKELLQILEQIVIASLCWLFAPVIFLTRIWISSYFWVTWSSSNISAKAIRVWSCCNQKKAAVQMYLLCVFLWDLNKYCTQLARCYSHWKISQKTKISSQIAGWPSLYPIVFSSLWKGRELIISPPHHERVCCDALFHFGVSFSCSGFCRPGRFFALISFCGFSSGNTVTNCNFRPRLACR